MNTNHYTLLFEHFQILLLVILQCNFWQQALKTKEIDVTTITYIINKYTLSISEPAILYAKDPVIAWSKYIS